MRKVILGSAMAAGLLAAAGGVVGAIALAAMAWLGRNDPGASLTRTGALALTFGAVGVGLGLILAGAGWRAWRGSPSRAASFPRWGWWLLALALVLGAGQAALMRDLGWLAAPLHVAASAAGACLVLAWIVGTARRGGGAVTRRPFMGSLAWGGLGGTGLAIVAESLLALLVLLAAAIYLGIARPDWLAQLQRLADGMQSGGGLDERFLASLARSPLTWLVVLVGGCVVVPFIEELAKSLAVPLVIAAGRSVSRLDGFLFGAAAGAGFALLEGATNGSLALAAGSAWWGTMLMRVAAAGMHALAAGIGGLAWQAGLAERRWLRAAGLGLLAMALHGAWNFCALSISLAGLGLVGAGGSAALIGGALTVALTGLLGVLCVGVVIALAVIPRRLAREAGAEVEAKAEAVSEAEIDPGVDEDSAETDEDSAAPTDPTEGS